MANSILPESSESLSQPQLIFRPFSSEQVVKLQSWFKTRQQIIMWSGYKFGFPKNAFEFSAQLRVSQIPGYVLMLRGSQDILGFGQMMSDGERCHLVRVAVNPEYRGRGYGRKLLNCLCAQGQRKYQPRYISLFVNKTNEAAIRLYTSNGFKLAQYAGAMPNKESWYLEKPVKARV